MSYCIKDPQGELLDYTQSYDKDDCWNKYLGFEAVDDQWAWQRQKAEERGFTCVEVEIKEKT